jgi:beta-glucosidase
MGTTPDFAWGLGTSAYQIEGAWQADGKGESIWDHFLHDRGITPNGNVACDHYNRLDADLDLLASLGVNAYRFSTAWTRVLPDGTGAVNPAGLAFYDRLVDGLLDRGITPWLTLYHWDLPQALQHTGGWANRDSVEWFTRYAQVMVDYLGDRVTNWITINEPWVSSFLGHRDGIFAPGLQDFSEALRSAHHQLLAHGEATRLIHDDVPHAKVGIALDCRPALPASDSPEDIEATRHFDGFRNRWFFDPVFGKGYPADILDQYVATDRLPTDLILPGDLERIAEPIDFCGVNYYTSIRIDVSSSEQEFSEGPVGAPAAPGYTEMGWRVDPDALGAFVRRVHEEWYQGPIVITENGASFSDAPDTEGLVHDTLRVEYLDQHINQIEALRRDGVPVDGYFVWSFLDNLEWVSGFAQRFGVVHVDHTTQERTIKDSGYWYRDRISRGPEIPAG